MLSNHALDVQSFCQHCRLLPMITSGMPSQSSLLCMAFLPSVLSVKCPSETRLGWQSGSNHGEWPLVVRIPIRKQNGILAPSCNIQIQYVTMLPNVVKNKAVRQLFLSCEFLISYKIELLVVWMEMQQNEKRIGLDKIVSVSVLPHSSSLLLAAAAVWLCNFLVMRFFWLM